MPFPLIPSFAGIFWYLVTKKPALVAKFILKTPFSISTMASVAKWVFGLTTAHYLSSTLTSFSRNNWRLADTHRWQWNKEVAVVTGGCSGIGEEIVKALSKKGVKVVILDVTALPDRLKGVAAHYIKCDVTDFEAVDAAAVEIREKLGAPSILVNNAGIGHDFPVFELPPQRVKKLIEVNMTSHWFTCRAFCPDMVKNNKGHIVEIASMSSFVGVGVFSDYSATKTALISFVESLREQLRGWYGSPDVHVTIVHPLFVETAMTSYRKDAIEKATGKMLSAPAVGRQIADQIFACKGEQMVIPDTHSILRTTRAWPGWLLAAFKDLTSPAKLSKVE